MRKRITYIQLFLHHKLAAMRGKTGIKVDAYIEDTKHGGLKRKRIDLVDLKPGMMVREIGGLMEVTGEVYDDGEDYMIPCGDTAYSPLCVE